MSKFGGMGRNGSSGGMGGGMGRGGNISGPSGGMGMGRSGNTGGMGIGTPSSAKPGKSHFDMGKKTAHGFLNKSGEKSSDAASSQGTRQKASENYIQNYKTTQAQQAQKLAQQNQAQGAAAQNKQAEMLKETNIRNRATSLRDQVTFWKNKKGSGEFDEAYVDANINNCEREYFSIDSRYRPY